MKPAKRLDANAYRLQHPAGALSAERVADFNKILLRMVPELIEAGCVPYLASCMATSWPDGLFRDDVESRCAGLGEVHFPKGKSVLGQIWWLIVYAGHARRRKRQFLLDLCIEGLSCVAVAINVDVDLMREDIMSWPLTMLPTKTNAIVLGGAK